MVPNEPSEDIKNHGTVVDRRKGRVRCNYCHKLMYSGFSRLKHHLGGVRGDGAACTEVPANVKELYQNEKYERGKRGVLLLDPQKELPSKRVCSQRSESFDQIRHKIESLIDLRAINLTNIREIMSSVAGNSRSAHDSYPDLKGQAPQVELSEMHDYVKGIKQSWSSTGCSILLDTWRNEQGHVLVIFLADCPEGPIYLQSYNVSSYGLDTNALQSMLNKVIEDVGAQNVVQIIACSTAGWLGAMEQQFADICKTGFWTVGASHCIDLMLEKMALLDSIKPVMDKAATLAKFMSKRSFGLRDPFPEGKSAATPFMTLENIIEEKGKLKEVVTSSAWEASVWTSTEEGKRVHELVKDPSFWSGARMVLKASVPLVYLLALIHRADKPFMGYIYETMDQVKEAIKMEFGNLKSRYMPFWEVIDEVWDAHLHTPLHAAGYYLNPNLFYSGNFFLDLEVAFGLLCCIVRLVRDKQTQDLISLQLDKYRHAQVDFREGSSIGCRDKPPLEWWSEYGRKCPELQRFAICILSQTCDGPSRYGLKREMAQKLLESEMNGVDQQEQAHLRDLAFLHYNQQLRHFRHHQQGGQESL